MDLAMRQGYGACALPLCGGGRLLLGRSETDQFLFFFSIFIFFIVFSCVLFVFSFMASPRSARTDALFTVREPPVLRLDARRALAADENFAASRSVTLDACFDCRELAATYARVPAFSRQEAHSAIIARPPRWLRGGTWLGLGDEFLSARVVVEWGKRTNERTNCYRRWGGGVHFSESFLRGNYLWITRSMQVGRRGDVDKP